MDDIKSAISLISACDCNRVIGKDGEMLWHLPKDLEFFVANTLNKPIINGHTSYMGLTKDGNNPFTDQLIIVLTKRHLKSAEEANIVFIDDPIAALRLADDWAQKHKLDEIMILGGGQIYELYLPHANKIYLTEIEASFEGNVFFPQLDPLKWKKTKLKSVLCKFKLNFNLYERY